MFVHRICTIITNLNRKFEQQSQTCIRCDVQHTVNVVGAMDSMAWSTEEIDVKIIFCESAVCFGSLWRNGATETRRYERSTLAVASFQFQLG